MLECQGLLYYYFLQLKFLVGVVCSSESGIDSLEIVAVRIVASSVSVDRSLQFGDVIVSLQRLLVLSLWCS